jgi:hypothetical protein
VVITKEDGTDGPCNEHRRHEINIKLGVGGPEGKKPLLNLGVDGKIILTTSSGNN